MEAQNKKKEQKKKREQDLIVTALNIQLKNAQGHCSLCKQLQQSCSILLYHLMSRENGPVRVRSHNLEVERET